MKAVTLLRFQSGAKEVLSVCCCVHMFMLAIGIENKEQKRKRG